MKDKRSSFGRWFLVPVLFVASTFAAYVLGIGLLIYLEPIEIHWAIAAHLNFPPSDLLHIADLIAVFLAVVIWIVPVAWAVGFAIRARTALALLWGLSISLLLMAAFVWFRAQPFSRILAVAAGVGAICGIILLVIRKFPARSVLLIEVASFCLLFVPSLLVLASLPKQPSLARKVWSVVLQKGTWQAMNTGSEFGATRQLTFAGDRIIAVFDAGSAGYEGKQPMSRYRVLSLDRNTGAVKNQMEFTGRWGNMPFVYGTQKGKVALVGSGPIRLLNSDLSSTGMELNYKGIIHTISPDGTMLGWETLPGLTLLAADTLQPIGKLSQSNPVSISQNAVLNTDHYWYRIFPKDKEFVTLTDKDGEHLLFHGNCGSSPAQFLTDDRILINECGKVHVLDTRGKTIVEANSVSLGGLFAGVSQNGNRFALQYSDERGDPPQLLYEEFIIYDAITATPVASISVDDLPERQSWSAFSPNGRFFAVGNPNKLTLYQVP